MRRESKLRGWVYEGRASEAHHWVCATGCGAGVFTVSPVEVPPSCWLCERASRGARSVAATEMTPRPR